MKSLAQVVIEANNKVKTTKIRSSKYFSCIFANEDREVHVKSSQWNKTVTDDITAFWTPDSAWIFYFHNGSGDWAVVANGTIKPDQYNKEMFNDFEELLMNGVTIPELYGVDTDLK